MCRIKGISFHEQERAISHALSCATFSRRAVLSHVPIILSLGALVSNSSQAQEAQAEAEWLGCLPFDASDLNLIKRANSWSSNPDDYLYYSSSGDTLRDQKLNSELFGIARAFEFTSDAYPGFIVLDEGHVSDAWASASVTFVEGTQGTVALGLGLIRTIEEESVEPSTAIATVLAHEFSHIYQRRANYFERIRRFDTTLRRLELHADYLAGWYISSKPSITPEQIQSMALKLFELGDFSFNDVGHHGLPQERFTAVMAGYFSGRTSQTNANGAAERGWTFVQGLG